MNNTPKNKSSLPKAPLRVHPELFKADCVVSTCNPCGSRPLHLPPQSDRTSQPSTGVRMTDARGRIEATRSPHLLIAFASFLLGILTACHSEKDTSPQANKALLSPIPVSVTEIKKQSITLSTAHMGTVQTTRRAIVPSRLHANIDAVLVKVGQAVKQGERLVQLDDRELKTAVDQARAEYERAQADWNRYRSLLSEKSVTQREADQVRSIFESAKANLAAAETRLGHASVKAPFKGIIEQVNVEPGEGIGAGQALLSIEAPDHMEITTHLPLHGVGNLKIGTPLTFTTTSGGIQGEATITEQANVADPMTRTVTVILQIQSPKNIQSGDVVRVWVPSEPMQGIWIPSASIQVKGQMEYVYLVHDSKAAMRLVKSGRKQSGEDLVQITSGLKEGDILINSPSKAMVDGHPITLQ
jgi:membrane fusion protein, multidrug efflux system